MVPSMQSIMEELISAYVYHSWFYFQVEWHEHTKKEEKHTQISTSVD